MQILYRTPPGSGTYTPLADETSPVTQDRISQYRPVLGKTPQQDQLAFSAGQFVADRGNALWNLSFVVDRQHSDADVAIAFLALHAAIFGQVPVSNQSINFDLKVILLSGIVYMPNCAVTRFEPDAQSDQSTRCAYGFTGGSYTTTAP